MLVAATYKSRPSNFFLSFFHFIIITINFFNFFNFLFFFFCLPVVLANHFQHTLPTLALTLTLSPTPLSLPLPLPLPTLTPTPTPTPTPTLQILLPRYDIWREAQSTDYHNSACSQIALSTGTLLIDASTIIDIDRNLIIYPTQSSQHSQSSSLHLPIQTHILLYNAACIDGHPVQIKRPPAYRNTPNIVAAFDSDWAAWTASSQGKFSLSIVPYIYSIAISTTICLLLSILVLCFQWSSRPPLFKLALVVSTAYLIAITAVSMAILYNQYKTYGYQNAAALRRSLRHPAMYGLNLAFNTILYLAQVQATMLLFSRKKEKRIVFWIGGSLTVVGQSIWGISVFHKNILDSALPAFAYLFQIALAVLFLCCTCYYAITHYHSVLGPDMLPITLFAILTSAASLVLFIVDLANVWVIEWSDAVSWVTTAVSIIGVWEWFERSDKLERHREKNGILGRQIFEEDALFGPHDYHSTDEEYDDPKHKKSTVVRFSSTSNNNNSGGSSGSSSSGKRLILHTLQKTTPQSSQTSHHSNLTLASSSSSTNQNKRLYQRTSHTHSQQGRPRIIASRIQDEDEDEGNDGDNDDDDDVDVDDDNNDNDNNDNDNDNDNTDPMLPSARRHSHSHSHSHKRNHSQKIATLRKYYHRVAVDPLIHLSDFLINLGLAFSRPISAVSHISSSGSGSNNPTPCPNPGTTGSTASMQRTAKPATLTMPTMPTMPTLPTMSTMPTMPTIPTMPTMPTMPIMPTTRNNKIPPPTVQSSPTKHTTSTADTVLYHYANNRLHFYTRNAPNTTFSKRWSAGNGRGQPTDPAAATSSGVDNGGTAPGTPARTASSTPQSRRVVDGSIESGAEVGAAGNQQVKERAKYVHVRRHGLRAHEHIVSDEGVEEEEDDVDDVDDD